MYRKKTSIIIATLLLVSIFFTGCGVNTLSFIGHLEEIQKVSTTKPTQATSTLSINNVEFPANIVPADQKVLVNSIKEFLNTYSISATQKVHPTKEISTISFDTINKKTNLKEQLFTLNYKDQAFALSVGPKLTELLKDAPADVQLTVATFEEKLIPVSMLSELFAGQDLMFNSLTDRKSLLDVNDKAFTYLKEFMKIYTTSDTELISKDGNSYVFEMNTSGLVKFIDVFVTQTIQNKDAIVAATIKFYESLTEEEYNALYGQILPGGKEEILDALKQALAEPLPEGTVEAWQATYAKEVAPVLSTIMDGSSMRMRTWKENNIYYTNTYSVIRVTDLQNPTQKYKADILTKDSIKVISGDFDITMPTEIIPKEILEAISSGYSVEIEPSLEN